MFTTQVDNASGPEDRLEAKVMCGNEVVFTGSSVPNAPGAAADAIDVAIREFIGTLRASLAKHVVREQQS